MDVLMTLLEVTFVRMNNIGVQEAMAVFLGLFSWLEWLEGTATTVYVDNEGVRYAFISGTSKCKELALMVAKMLHEAAARRWGLLFRRVETKANLADGPTREDFSYLGGLQAKWRMPVMPVWVEHMWDLVTLKHQM